jgi:hypothetical protein
MERISRPSPDGRVNDYSLRLATATIQAVDQMGAVTSEEIERTADQILCGATEVADNLRALATAIRGHSKIAGEQVTEFCNKANSVFEGVRGLQAQLLAGEVEAEAEVTEHDELPLRGVIRTGPANSEPGRFSERVLEAEKNDHDKVSLREAISTGPANSEPKLSSERVSEAKKNNYDKVPLRAVIGTGPGNGHDRALSPRQTARRRDWREKPLG